MKYVIEVKQLSKSYKNLIAVDRINLSVKRGTIYGLLGANGAGKTTTIECILGIKSSDSGTVSILSHNPIKERKYLYQKVGVQFQESNYQPEIKVFELCQEISSLYKSPSDWKNSVSNLE